ncbi:purine-nucleoside phosphorylase [bacterium]|nr:purine-nucleoside phosphorylase [bacterium]
MEKAGFFLAPETLAWRPPWPRGAKTAVLLGSGLGSGLLAALQVRGSVSYADIPSYPLGTVPGHPGTLAATGDLLLFAGRLHLYEGHPPKDLAAPVALACSLGATRLVQFSAVGGIHPEMRPGTLVGVSDHLNLTGRSPLEGAPKEGHDPFIPGFFHSRPGLLAGRRAAAATGQRWREGVYAQALGPQLETPAEITALERAGASVVGMSTVPEAIAAAFLGMEHLAVGVVTNAAPMRPDEGHAEVLAAAAETAKRLPAFLEALLEGWE